MFTHEEGPSPNIAGVAGGTAIISPDNTEKVNKDTFDAKSVLGICWHYRHILDALLYNY